ncbi:hypothetical protein BN946_scf185028.g15 [Trametes cinnabarina]|uniref:RING-CH-type domain-containing protein n=1 Tax=Pycnoporus cinnabarinus TaxID=5643 RepID=A0A060SX20_PYCCI|nr:hypothetical protein BN946_scf185028.g15 [Trametes cinnabarina]
MAQPQTEWVPTVDDLKVKLCYICREEDRFDNPEDPPRAWTHPCACTLVAHESCLLQWIKSAQQSSSLNKNALKCPQCGVRYELESDNPLVLRALNALNTLLSNAGQAATIVGCVSLTVSFGFTIYVVATSYGAFAVKEFLGEEMYNLLLTDDPSNFPSAFAHARRASFLKAKDCLGLLHSWLKKRELESRRVKSRSFAGVDISGLELINPPPGLTSGAQAGPA